MSRPGDHPLPLAHRLVAVLCLALLAVYVVRGAAVAAWSAVAPQAAANVWTGHPQVQAQLGLVAIGAATAQHRPIPEGAFAALRSAATRSPLASEPFLVRGVQADTGGNPTLARAAFLAAERRDPRSLPARYFLAQQDLQSGNIAHGLTELGALARLAPDGSQSVAPFVAEIAERPRNWPSVRVLLRNNPQLAEAVLTRLAHDADNAPAVLALAEPSSVNPAAPWAAPLLQSLIDAGDYQGARRLWANLGRVAVAPSATLFDADFRQAGPPPPFNWSLASSSVGLAERRPGGTLHAIFYGQQDGPLARQLLVLKPGSYRLSMRVAGDEVRLRVLAWSVSCAKSGANLARFPLAPGQQAETFTVPAGCPAQWLELVGASTDIPQQSDASISALQLQKVGS